MLLLMKIALDKMFGFKRNVFRKRLKGTCCFIFIVPLLIKIFYQTVYFRVTRNLIDIFVCSFAIEEKIAKL